MSGDLHCEKKGYWIDFRYPLTNAGAEGQNRLPTRGFSDQNFEISKIL
jgi:hypothetical protein